MSHVILNEWLSSHQPKARRHTAGCFDRLTYSRSEWYRREVIEMVVSRTRPSSSALVDWRQASRHLWTDRPKPSAGQTWLILFCWLVIGVLPFLHYNGKSLEWIDHLDRTVRYTISFFFFSFFSFFFFFFFFLFFLFLSFSSLSHSGHASLLRSWNGV